MPFVRCLSTLGCPDLSLDETLALAARHGIGAVELRALGGSVDLATYLQANYKTPAALAERLRDSPVRVVALNASLRLVDPTTEHRAELERLAPWAHAAGVRWLRVFDGGTTMHEAEIAAARTTLAWWAQQQARSGGQVDLMIETHDSLFSAERLKRFLAAIPGAAILWDAHHTWRKGGEDPQVTWRAVREHVVHVHVKDSVPVPSARHPFSYVLPGEGGFPMHEVRVMLERDGFAGPVSLEWEKLWHPYLPTLEEALRVMRERNWW